jgi:hypothetical protein
MKYSKAIAALLFLFLITLLSTSCGNNEGSFEFTGYVLDIESNKELGDVVFVVSSAAPYPTISLIKVPEELEVGQQIKAVVSYPKTPSTMEYSSSQFRVRKLSIIHDQKPAGAQLDEQVVIQRALSKLERSYPVEVRDTAIKSINFTSASSTWKVTFTENGSNQSIFLKKAAPPEYLIYVPDEVQLAQAAQSDEQKQPSESMFEVQIDELSDVHVNQSFKITGSLINKSKDSWNILDDDFTCEIFDENGNIVPQGVPVDNGGVGSSKY